MSNTPKRRTKRRYAYELYPHPNIYDDRPLSEEVPYLYADAIGWDVTGTGWMTSDDRESSRFRIRVLVRARRIALLSDALLQGITGDEAHKFVQKHLDESGELTWDRAVHYGVPVDSIKPYGCGPEPDDHYCQPTADGLRPNVPCGESQCEHCTEEVP